MQSILYVKTKLRLWQTKLSDKDNLKVKFNISVKIEEGN